MKRKSKLDRDWREENRMKYEELIVKKEHSYIRFGKGEYDHSLDGINYIGRRLDFVTVKGEMLVIDLDKKNRILGIEIVKV